MTSLMKLVNALIILLLSIPMAFASVSSTDEFDRVLIGKNNNEKEIAIEWLVANLSGGKAKPILRAWLEGNLFYYRNKQSESYQQLYIIPTRNAKQAENIWDGELLPVSRTRDFAKVRVNNKLRSIIRMQLASLGLNSPDANVRLQAAEGLLGQTDHEIIARISAQLSVEQDAKVQDRLQLALAISTALDNTALTQQRIAAVDVISEYKQAVVLQTFNQLSPTSLEPELAAAVEKGLGQYHQSQRFYSGVETVFFGLSLGSVLVLAGIGLAITFGVMGVINMAHGELIMIGAYTTYVMQQLLPQQAGVALLLSIPMAFVISGLVGIAIERSVIKHLYGRPLETLLATFGISLILQQAVRSIFSPLNRSVSTPDWMAGAWELNPMLSLTYNRLYIILFCALVFITMVMILKKTPLGLQVRAVSQNRAMARAMGIRSERVDALTFGLGSGVAGVAGVALSQLTNVGPNMGQAYIIDSFMVVVFGGVGNLWGTLVAGLSLGLFNKLLEPWAGAVLAKILILVFIILFIQKRPRGLFPQRGRAAES
ncbi:urea ABC transporter permease subunit UrtB [Photobacterium gaetbulicola]|uniref:Urea ABC transporter, permease protein UrtB n=1 Tax=Photobacterium gaetbulicola Gung47 TaxID=658445 RepID=A0A0C5WTS7_9GAMM|nr:urea ABC transporter permease subunit UrtB [Photobacterium gaetbulicola]AJR06450.1 urea ABC transporter, permease protein UrtB [Photobacterium gaetbulicola Gung47]PSU05539.1 urea ABC transporter permease subunit UrtB [Photobacterium gaetbulicola]